MLHGCYCVATVLLDNMWYFKSKHLQCILVLVSQLLLTQCLSYHYIGMVADLTGQRI